MSSNQGSLIAVILSGLFFVLAYVFSQFVLSSQVGLVFGVMMAMVLFFAIFKISDEHLIILMMLTLASGSCFYWPLQAKSFYLRFYLLFLVTIKTLMLMQGQRSGSAMEKSRMTAFHAIFAYLSIYSLMSSLYSVDISLTFQRAVSFVMLSLVIAGYFWSKATDMAYIEKIITSFWKTHASILILGVIFFFLMPGSMRVGGRLRLVLGNPNQLGHYSAMMLPIAVWYYYESKSQSWLKSFVLFMIPLCILGSASRASIIGATISCTILFFTCYRKQATYVLMASVFILALSFLLNIQDENSLADSEYVKKMILRDYSLQTGSGRLGVWKSSWELILKKPILGYGFGITDKLFQLKFFPDLPLEFQGGHTHNGYVEELLNLGFLGASAFFALIIWFLIVGVRVVANAINSRTGYEPLQVAIFCSIVAGIISGIFESWFSSVGSFFCFPFWLLGMLLIRFSGFKAESTCVESPQSSA